MTVNIGVIGTGNIGSDHIRRIGEKCRGGRVVAVTDIDTERAEAIAARVDAKAFPSGAELIANAEVEAVLVASAAPTHAEYVLGCLAAGKPVFSEKPLATTADDCERIVAAEQALGRRLVQVGFMRRFDTGYRQLKAALDGGEIGDPLMIHCAHRNPFAPESYHSEMAATDTAIHEIDAIRWLLDEELTSVQVLTPRKTANRHAHLQDPQIMLYASASGVRADVEVFVNCRYGYDIQCEAVGETGAARLPDPARLAVRSGGHSTQTVPQTWQERFGAAFDVEIQEWIDTTAAGETSGPTAWDGYAAAVIADATVTALHSGSVVPIPIPRRPDFYG